MTSDDEQTKQRPLTSATRKDLQLGRRAFHLINGSLIATAYGLLFTHQQAVYLIGTLACLIYLLERIRISYPDLMQKVPWLTHFLLRAEEEFKESSMIPYAIALLLTIITFPKTIALIAIYTLAIADPLSAIVGISWGKHHIVSQKSVEGSLAFFTVTFFCSSLVLFLTFSSYNFVFFACSFLLATTASAFEMLPIKLDDNLTIPLFVGFFGWTLASLFSLPL